MHAFLVLHFLLTSTQGAGPPSDQPTKELLLAEAPARWDAYGRFATRLQGTVTCRREITYLDKGSSKDYSFENTIRQNDRCALVSTPRQPNQADSKRLCYLTNPRYTAEIRRDGLTPDGSILLDYNLAPNAI